MARSAELSAEAIAHEALSLLDSEGIAGLTMRRLAARLGVKAASLYYHVRSQDDLIYAMQDIVDAEIDLSGLADNTAWGLADFATSYRDAYQRHPALIDLVNRRPLKSDTALRVYNSAARHLRARGVPADRIIVLLTLLDIIVLGSGGETLYSDFDREPGDYRPELPELADALEATDPHGVGDQAFGLALKLLEGAVEHVIQRAQQPSPE
jgi:AcrR family transcriptional regulator